MRLERILSLSSRKCICSTTNNSTDSKSTSQEIPKVPSVKKELNVENFKENPKLLSLLEVTSKLGIYFDRLINSLKVSPELLDRSPVTWENTFRELTTYGFSKRDCLKMVTMFPELMKMVEKDELQIAMANWMNCQLGYDNMLDLLANHPNLLSISPSELSQRIPLLFAVTKSRGKNLTRLLRGCPSLLYSDWREITAKVDYVETVMKIDVNKENLSRCYMFNRSLDDIKTRHAFLERAGIYIRPKKVKGTKRQQEQQPWSKNPPLNKITDTSDEVFISKVAIGLTLEELEVFKEMYKEELDEISDSDSDDSSDED
ncbi:hypothetical protein C0J52_10408 [Blattella germanica]|nr:hypothetical protein C0J52_10408 [Blattella germanica]